MASKYSKNRQGIVSFIANLPLIRRVKLIKELIIEKLDTLDKKMNNLLDLASTKSIDLHSNLRPKVFCIGTGKTGTTSLETALKMLGFKMGDQASGELLIEDWAKRDFRRIIQLCKTADAFQDVPFCLDYTYQILDHAFPNAKFILTIRNSGEEWFESLTRFHSKRLAKRIGIQRLPTIDDHKNDPYHYKGWMWRTFELVYGTDTPLYDRKTYIDSYLNHNETVKDYFKNRPEDLLILNVSETDAMKNLCEFLNIQYSGQIMPHLNKSE